MYQHCNDEAQKAETVLSVVSEKNTNSGDKHCIPTHFLFITAAVCVILLIKLRWPKNKSLYDIVYTRLMTLNLICILTWIYRAKA